MFVISDQDSIERRSPDHIATEKMSCRIPSLHNMCTSTLRVQSWILQQEIQSSSSVTRAIYIESLKADIYIKLVIQEEVWFSKTSITSRPK